MKLGKLKLFKNFIYITAIFLLAAVAGTFALSALSVPGGVKVFTVQSGSMEPEIKTGSVVVVKPANNYEEGEIVTFRAKDSAPNSKTGTITHRINEVIEKDGEIVFKTKGDANSSPDTDTVKKANVIGREILSVPYLGYPVTFAKTELGFIFLVIVPATVIIYSELLNIKREAKRLILERKKRKLTTIEKVEVAIGEEEMKLEEKVKSLQ
jgi:signal peptidase